MKQAGIIPEENRMHEENKKKARIGYRPSR